MTQDTFKEIIDNVWPNTKKELEKTIKNAKVLIEKGEQHLRDVSEKSMASAKKLSLKLRREKLYYNLGKLVSSTAQAKLATTKKIQDLTRQIKAITRQIKRIGSKKVEK